MSEHRIMSFVTSRISAFLATVKRHGHHLSFVMCIVGFVLDALYLPSIDHSFTQIVATTYFCIATASILLAQAVISNMLRAQWLIRIAPLYPILIQFLFGALLSIVFVYYFRSASLLTSWPIVCMLGMLMLGNELWKKHLDQLKFQVTVLFLLFLFFSIFTVPLIVGNIGTMVFLLSVTISIALLGLFLLMLSHFAWTVMRPQLVGLFAMLSSSALIIVALYFVNILPPIPLITRADGVYHALAKDMSGAYVAQTEEAHVNQGLIPFMSTKEFHRLPNEPIYFFSAVYAPTVLHTPIVHVWQCWNQSTRKWDTSSRIEFPMSGGRDGGYRGYSEKLFAPAGLWRVLVETSDGRTISQEKFMIVDVATPVTLTQVTL